MTTRKVVLLSPRLHPQLLPWSRHLQHGHRPEHRAPSTPPPARPSTRSPPRYPSTSPGTAKVVTVPVLRLEADGRQMSPRAANIRALGTAFNNADLQTNEDEMPWALEEINLNGDYDAMAYDNDGYDFRAGLPRQLPLQQGLVAPRPVQAVRRQVRGRMVLPSQSTSPQMRKGEGRGRGGRIELTPEHVLFPLCTIVQIYVVVCEADLYTLKLYVSQSVS